MQAYRLFVTASGILAGMESLGAILRAARLEVGLSQEEVAVRAGISTQHVRQLETGARPNPGFITVARLARALGVDLELLAGRTVADPPLTDKERTLLETLKRRADNQQQP